MSELNFRSDFFGTKDDLVMEIERFEANFPDLYLLHRKKNGAPLPVTPRVFNNIATRVLLTVPSQLREKKQLKVATSIKDIWLLTLQQYELKNRANP